jgi:hypothetical protein
VTKDGERFFDLTAFDERMKRLVERRALGLTTRESVLRWLRFADELLGRDVLEENALRELNRASFFIGGSFFVMGALVSELEQLGGIGFCEGCGARYERCQASPNHTCCPDCTHDRSG